MSINPDNDMLSYSDHDVHHVRHRAVFDGGDPDDPNFDSIVDFDITERGLDPDELAELRAMRVSYGTIVQASDPQDSVGTASFDLGCGFNLGRSEFIGEQVNRENIDVDGNGNTDIVQTTGDTDEVGQLWGTAFSTSPPFDDDANGNGGGGVFIQNNELLNMDELFGSGPYVDAADDFVSRIQLNETNNIQQLGVETQYSLYYNVDQVEGGRTRFGR